MARKELTPNADIGYFETMAFNMAGMAYEQYLRDLIIEKVDSPESQWDDRVLAMFDALFGES
jgi:hypothetical protein